MKIRSFLMAVATMTTIIFITGCGVRKKNLLSRLTPGMTKKEVVVEIGKPDTISSPIFDKKGDAVDIWEYSLATVDKNQESKRLGAVIALCIICPILAFMPSLCMESPYSYDNYFLKFVNNLLSCWGKQSDIRKIEPVKSV